jgi:hypothetical protein
MFSRDYDGEDWHWYAYIDGVTAGPPQIANVNQIAFNLIGAGTPSLRFEGQIYDVRLWVGTAWVSVVLASLMHSDTIVEDSVLGSPNPSYWYYCDEGSGGTLTSNGVLPNIDVVIAAPTDPWGTQEVFHVAVDVKPVPANVHLWDTDSSLSKVMFGEVVSKGDFVYRDSSDQKYYKALNSVASKSKVAGVVILHAGVDGVGLICSQGLVDLGATLVAGAPYALSSTGGLMRMPVYVGTGGTVTHLGYALTSGKFLLSITQNIVVK